MSGACLTFPSLGFFTCKLGAYPSQRTVGKSNNDMVCERFGNSKVLIQETVLFSPAVATQIRGGQVVCLSWMRSRTYCTGVERSFPCSQAVVDKDMRSVQGRRVPSSLAPSEWRPPRRSPLRQYALLSRRVLGALRPADPGLGFLSASMSPLVSSLAVGLGSSFPFDPSRAIGFV